MKQFLSLFQKKVTYTLENERQFLTLVIIFFIAAALFIDYPSIVMWIGFGLAGYSVIANDSIQTIGVFLASNEKYPWWILWLFIGGIFLATVTYSFIHYG